MRLQGHAQVAMHGRLQPGREALGQGLLRKIFGAQMGQFGGGDGGVELEGGEGVARGELGKGKTQHQRRQNSDQRRGKAAAQSKQHVAASIAQAAALMLMSLVSLRAQVAPIRGGGVFGGELRVPIASAPQTFNPVFGTDASAKLIASLTQADLMHINPRTLAVEPALATAVEHRTPTRWIVHLRHGVRFSDGEPFTAQDVAFSFRVYTDEKLDPPGRELLTVNGKPITCKVVDETTVEMDLPAPLAVGDRVFDSVWMLPRHKLASAYEAGKFEHAWDSGTALGELTGLGPFRVAGLQPGQEIRLERNPQFWRSDAQ